MRLIEHTDRLALAGTGRAVLGVLVALLVVTSGVGVAAAVPDATTTDSADTETTAAGPEPVGAIDRTASAERVEVGASTVEAAPGKRLAARGSSDALEGGGATISGQVFYQDEDGNYHPARQVKVVVQDKDWVEKYVYDSTRTDDQGRFTLSFDASEPDWGSSSSVVVEVYATNPAAKVTSTAVGGSYEVETDKFTVSNGDTKRLQIVPAKYNAAWEAADYVLGARRTFTSESSWTPDQVQVEYPSGTTQSNSVPGLKRIQLMDRSADHWKAGWDRTMVHHEYGHQLMDQLYGGKFWNWPVNDLRKKMDKCHQTHSETNDGYAFTEGWAEFTQAAIADDPNVDGMSLETEDYYEGGSTGSCYGSDAGEFDGASVEGSVAGILWDLYDGGAGDDDGLDYSLDRIVSAIDDHDVTSAHELWTVLRTDANHEELRQIYYDHGIVKPDRLEGETPRLGANGSVGAQVGHGDADRFTVDLDAGEQLTGVVEFENPNADLRVTVEGPDGTVLNRSEEVFLDQKVSVTASQDGVYTLVVDGRTDVPSTYDLDLTTTPPSDDGDGSSDDGEGSDGTVRIPDSTLEDLGILGDLDSWWFEMPALGNATCGEEIDRFHVGASADPSSAQYRRGTAVTTTVSGECDVRIRVEPVHTAAGTDLDLYATLDGRTPTTSDFDRQSSLAISNETLVIEAEDLDGETTIGATLWAYSGTGNATVVVEEVDG